MSRRVREVFPIQKKNVCILIPLFVFANIGRGQWVFYLCAYSLASMGTLPWVSMPRDKVTFCLIQKKRKSKEERGKKKAKVRCTFGFCCILRVFLFISRKTEKGGNEEAAKEYHNAQCREGRWEFALGWEVSTRNPGWRHIPWRNCRHEYVASILLLISYAANKKYNHSYTSPVQKLVNENKLPHLLFYGPPGTGKTSTILACARKMYGKNFRSMVLEVYRNIKLIIIFGLTSGF